MTERLNAFLRQLASDRGRSVYQPEGKSIEALRAFQDEVDTLKELESEGLLNIVGKPMQESSTGKRFIVMLHVELTGLGARTFLETQPDRGGVMAEASAAADPRNVFVVHGRNLEARRAMFRFLRSLSLNPIEWSQATMETGNALPFIGEILDAAFSKAQAVVVLLTPDDEARLREPFRSEDDPPYEELLTGQARPNVLFEAGMALGRHPERTVIVELGKLRPFSDIAGRHTVRLSNNTTARQELAQRLATAGCAVNLTGRDWHTEGEFEIQVIPPPHEAEAPPARKFITPPEYDEADMTALITAFITKNYPGRERFVLHYKDIDREINFVPGAARIYSKKAAEDGGYTVISQGNATITLQRQALARSVRLVRR
jgi:predicted nucleotide-binding protein